jgi:hypothetical protein
MTAITTVTTQQAVLHEKDLGQVVAIGLDTAVSAARNMRSLTVHFYSTQNGKISYVGADGSAKRAIEGKCTIPDLKTTADWDKFKTLIRPYDRGNWLVTAKLKNGRSMAIYASTPTEGEAELRRWVQLTNTEIMRMIHTDMSDDPKFRKSNVRMYPKYARLRVLRETSDPAKKSYTDPQTGEMFRVKTVKIPLLIDAPPQGLDQEILNPFLDS